MKHLRGLQRRRHRTWIVGVLACLVCGTVPGPARAGSYTISASAAQACALGYFQANVPGFGTSCGASGPSITAPTGGSADNDRQLWQFTSPNSALVITSVQISGITALYSLGYAGGAFWNPASANGGTPFTPGPNGGFNSGTISSSYFGIQLFCNDTKDCAPAGDNPNPEVGAFGQFTITVQENQAPDLVAEGSNNLFSESGKWVWNPAGDPWPATLSGSDPSGICDIAISVDGDAIGPPSPQNASTWQQCPTPVTDNATVDTTSVIPASGQLTLDASDSNAAQVQSTSQAVIDVDNIQPQVAITALNDANPGGWSVNHSVTLRVTPTVGPSGMSSFSCSDTVAGKTTPLALTADTAVAGSDDVTIDGNGTHDVACSVANNAIDPQGAHNTGTAAESVDIDEQPPSLSFEATDPSNPDQVIVDTSDNESVVAGGSIQITPQGSSTPISLPTSFTSAGQLIATIPDAALAAGQYTLQASATSQVGNTATITEPVTLPLRAAATSIVSFAKIIDPLIAKKVKERVLVGFHLVSEHKHGKTIKIAVGGHYKTITVIKHVEHCTTTRVKVAKHRWKLKTVCAKPHLAYQSKDTIGHGKKTTVYGELTTSQGIPIANQTVEILTTPRNGNDQMTQIGTASTNADGGWSATVPAGPSRTLEGYYPGSPTVLPTSGAGQLSVPAKLRLSITPTKLPWGKAITLEGKLEGGYVPAHGVAMRILIKIPGLKAPYVGPSFRTTPKGTFDLSYVAPVIFHRPHVLPIAVGMVGAEDAYPFLATRSNWVKVKFGVNPPSQVAAQVSKKTTAGVEP